MGQMRHSLEGKRFFGSSPDVEEALERLGTPMRFLEQVKAEAVPSFRGDASKRWSCKSGEADAKDILSIPTGFQYQGQWPQGLGVLLREILVDWIVYDQACIEWNVLEGQKKGVRLFLNILPPWSISVEGAKVLQAETAGAKPTRPISRGMLLEVPAVIAPLREAVRTLAMTAKEQQRAFAAFPAAVMGATQAKPLLAISEIARAELKATNDFGYLPAYERTKLSPTYIRIRRLRMVRLGLRLRSSLLSAFNKALESIGSEPGLEKGIECRFAEAWSIADLDRWEAELLAGKVDWPFVRKRLRFEDPSKPDSDEFVDEDIDHLALAED